MNWKYEIEHDYARQEMREVIGKTALWVFLLLFCFFTALAAYTIVWIDNRNIQVAIMAILIFTVCKLVYNLVSDDELKTYHAYRDRWLDQLKQMNNEFNELVVKAEGWKKEYNEFYDVAAAKERQLLEQDERCNKIIEQARIWKERAVGAEATVEKHTAHLDDIKKHADLRRINGTKKWTSDILRADFERRGFDPSLIYNQSDLDHEYRNGHRKAFNDGAKLYFDHYRAEEYEPDNILGEDTTSDQEDIDIPK